MSDTKVSIGDVNDGKLPPDQEALVYVSVSWRGVIDSVERLKKKNEDADLFCVIDEELGDLSGANIDASEGGTMVSAKNFVSLTNSLDEQNKINYPKI